MNPDYDVRVSCGFNHFSNETKLERIKENLSKPPFSPSTLLHLKFQASKNKMSQSLNGTSTSASDSTKIEKGSLVLVTGGGGLVGSSIVHQLLVDGFRVKATTRSISKLDEMKKKADADFGAGKLEVVEVKDLSVKGALNEALRGESESEEEEAFRAIELLSDACSSRPDGLDCLLMAESLT